MPKKVTFDVTANTKGAQKGLADVGKASQLLQGVLGRLGVVGQGISSVLDKFGGKSFAYSSDTLYDPPSIEAMCQEGLMANTVATPPNTFVRSLLAAGVCLAAVLSPVAAIASASSPRAFPRRR